MAEKHILRGFSTLLALAMLAACSAAPGGSQPAPDGEVSSVPPAGALRALEGGTDRGFYTVGCRPNDREQRFLAWVDYGGLRAAPLCAVPGCAHDSESCAAWIPDDRAVTMWAIDDETMLKQVDVDGDANSGTRTVLRCGADGSDPVVLLTEAAGTGMGARMEPRFTDGESLWYIRVDSDENGSSAGALYRQPLAGGDMQPVADGLRGAAILGCCGRSLVLERRDYSAWDAVQEPDWSAASTPEQTREMAEQYRAARDAVQVPCRVEFLDVDTGDTTPFLSWQAAAGEVPVCLWQDDTLYRLGAGRRSTLQWDRLDGGSGTVAVNWPVEEEGELDRLPLMVVNDRLIIQGDLYSAPDRYLNIAIDLTGGETTRLTLAFFDVFQEMLVPITILDRTGDSLLVEFESQLSIYNDEETTAVRWGLITFEDYLANRPNYREIDQSECALR